MGPRQFFPAQNLVGLLEFRPLEITIAVRARDLAERSGGLHGTERLEAFGWRHVGAQMTDLDLNHKTIELDIVAHHEPSPLRQVSQARHTVLAGQPLLGSNPIGDPVDPSGLRGDRDAIALQDRAKLLNLVSVLILQERPQLHDPGLHPGGRWSLTVDLASRFDVEKENVHIIHFLVNLSAINLKTPRYVVGLNGTPSISSMIYFSPSRFKHRTSWSPPNIEPLNFTTPITTAALVFAIIFSRFAACANSDVRLSNCFQFLRRALRFGWQIVILCLRVDGRLWHWRP